MKKKILSLGLVTVLAFGLLAGCGKSEGRVLYNDVDLSKIVELGEYKGLEVDTSSDEFKEILQDIVDSDIENNEFYTTETLTEGKIQEGDIANIDYTGKKDGVAFDGGTAEGYDLEIGSDSFIDGFEDGLIGVAIGDTVDLNLTFPENYGKEELNGAAVVFTVKVNSAQRKIKQRAEEYYAKLSFKSVSEYNSDARKRATQNYLIDAVTANSKAKEYPKADIDIMYATTKNYMETVLSESYGMDFAAYLTQIDQTEEKFKNTVIEEQIKPSMDTQMVLYAILDKEGIEFTKDEVDKEVENTVKEINDSSVDAEKVKSLYGEFYFEQMVVTAKVKDFLYKNAKLK